MPKHQPNYRLKQRDNGTWYIHWTDENRVSQKASTGTKDRAEAQKELGRYLMNEQAGDNSPDHGAHLLVSELWQVYLVKQIRGGKSETSTLTCWGNLEPHFGALAVVDVRNHVESYITKRRSGALGARGKGKDGTIRKELICLLACLNFCSVPHYGQCLFAPALIGPILRLFPRESPPRDRWLRDHEINQLLATAASMRKDPRRLSRVELFLWLALETGGRVQALLDLTWSRVDWEMGSIDLLVSGERQTSKYRPTVKISKTLMPVLQRAYAERRNKHPETTVLEHRGPIWESVQRVVWNAGLGKPGAVAPRPDGAKAQGISPHTFRHTAATMMARRGVPLFKIAKILGNSSRMVEKVYAKYQIGDLQDAVDAISSERLKPADIDAVQLRKG